MKSVYIQVYIFVFLSVVIKATFLNVIILSQNFPLENTLALSLESQFREITTDVTVNLLHRDFSAIIGSWAIWPIFRKLPFSTHDWFLFIDPYTKIDVSRLIGFLENQNKEELLFFGHGLIDKK